VANLVVTGCGQSMDVEHDDGPIAAQRRSPALRLEVIDEGDTRSASRFCAGVVRAIEIVERALQKYGPRLRSPRIVHNKHVVESLKAKGAHSSRIFPSSPHAVTIFSAHGVAKSVEEEAHSASFRAERTCPLVTKVPIRASVMWRRDAASF